MGECVNGIVDDLAPEILRQRLLVEGRYHCTMDSGRILEFLNSLALRLQLTTYTEPLISSAKGRGKPENQGFEAFLPLIESGISLYTWHSSRFLSMILYTCKPFDDHVATAHVVESFHLRPHVFSRF